MTPTTFAGAMVVLLASLILAVGALALIVRFQAPPPYWTRRDRRRRLIALVVAYGVLVALAVYWLSRPFFRGGCC